MKEEDTQDDNGQAVVENEDGDHTDVVEDGGAASSATRLTTIYPTTREMWQNAAVAATFATQEDGVQCVAEAELWGNSWSKWQLGVCKACPYQHVHSRIPRNTT